MTGQVLALVGSLFVFLAALLQVLTSPPASNLLSRAVYLAEGIPNRIDTIDEGAARREAHRRSE
jgi:multisubunit Na+/H+ antiporter MnhG subunit